MAENDSPMRILLVYTKSEEWVETPHHSADTEDLIGLCD